MERDKIRRAASALMGLTYMEWLVLKDAVDNQFERKAHLLDISPADAQEIADRIERERAGMMK